MNRRQFTSGAAALLAAVLAVSACASAGSNATTGADQAEQAEKADWSYDGETGPARWGELAAEYATCGEGKQQSPVDIDLGAARSINPGEPLDISYDYEPASYELVDEGHSIKAEVDGGGGGGEVTVGDEDYDLVQFHAHTPSEHAIDGRRSDLEVHLVHKNDDGDIVVVGVLVSAGDDQTGLDDAWQTLPEGDSTVTLADFDAATLLPQERTHIVYSGSLTTPPCTEGVQWLLLADEVQAPSSVISAFRDAAGDTARPLQPLGDRAAPAVEAAS